MSYAGPLAMPTRRSRQLRRFAPLCLAAAAAVAPLRADAADRLLEGPYPFRKENTLALLSGYAVGPGDTPSGVRAMLDYGYMLEGSLWLDIQIGMLASSCSPAGQGGCGPEHNDIAAVLAGVSWKLQMDIPAIPYIRAAAGPLFFFPDGAKNAIGFGLRSGVGFKYFLYEWFGLGAELSGLIGRANYDDKAMLSRTVNVVDLSVGAEVAF